MENVSASLGGSMQALENWRPAFAGSFVNCLTYLSERILSNGSVEMLQNSLWTVEEMGLGPLPVDDGCRSND